MPTRARAPITDSPWFWVTLFSLMGLVALAAMHRKYGYMQSRIERRYQVNERIAEDATEDPGRREYATPQATIIPLWPLAIALGCVATVAAVMLVRERSRRGQTTAARRCPRPGSRAEESMPS